MKIGFGPNFMKTYQEALERQKRRDQERRAKGRIPFFEMTREQQLESIRNNPRALKFLEEQGVVLDENGNFVKKEQKQK